MSMQTCSTRLGGRTTGPRAPSCRVLTDRDPALTDDTLHPADPGSGL